MKTRRHALAVLVLAMILVVACGGPGDDEKPSVTILSPRDQHPLVLGETLKVESRAKDDDSVSEIELRVNGTQVALYNVPEGQKSFRVEQSWVPPDAGSYVIAVVAFDGNGQESPPARITIHVEAAPAPTLPPTPTLLPTASATPTITPGKEVLGPSACTYDAVFVTDVTIPDNMELAPGTEFVKTWRLRNSGTCDWGAGFQFVFVKGEQMGGPASVAVAPTNTGATVDISVHFQAPRKAATHRGAWRMRTPGGQEFGDRPFVQVVVPPPATQTPEPSPPATAAPKPDLDITLISGNLELLVGQQMTLRVTVRNHGPGTTEQSALLRAVLQEGLELESSVSTLPVGGEGVALLTYTFDAPADLELVIAVDPDDEIAEKDEGNNTERIPVVVDPPLYLTRTITVTPGLSFDLDDAVTETESLDIEWRVVEGTVRLGLLNGAGAALLDGEAESISYALAAGLTWETEQLPLDDLAEGSLVGFRTSDDRIGYARIEAVLDEARTSARLTCLLWDWP